MKKTGPGSSVRQAVDKIVAHYNASRDSLISMLQDVQAQYHYLPEDALRHISECLGLPLIQVYGVATFFRAFSLKPRGEHIATVCLGTACHVRGAQAVLDEMERELGISSGETSEDMQFTLESVNCLGACALGPIVVIDGNYYSQMTPGTVKAILKKYRKESKGRKNEKVTVS